jgi:uncharacterized protein YybS (DUF2232 family)
MLSWIFPPLSYLSGATVALVTLRLGAREGIIIILGTAVVVILVALLGIRNPIPALALILAIWLPVWLCAQILRLTRSQGMMLVAIGILAGLFAISLRGLMGDVHAWWRAWLGNVLEHSPIQDTQVLTPAMLDQAALMMNGLMAAAISLSLIMTLLIARWWQAIVYNPGGFQTEFQALRLPRLLAIPMLVALLLVTIQWPKGSGYGLIMDLVFVASTLYVFQGLAVIHHRIRAHNQSTAWLVALYLLVFLLPHYMYLLLVMTGLMDSFIDFRGLERSAKDAHDQSSNL